MSFPASHLILRNGKYHFKMRVPSAPIPIFKTTCIRRSFKTYDEIVWQYTK
jgi:hypothetical protein